MKKIVLTFGVISGVVISTMMLIAFAFSDAIGFERSQVVGYTSMIVAFLMVFFGVRSYRDNVGKGAVKFGRALAVGSLIVAVSSMFYVATWELVYYKLDPQFMTKYQAYVLEKARTNGESDDAIAKKKIETEKFIEMYKNPFINAAITFLEPLPVGLIVALVSAGVLSRGKREDRVDYADISATPHSAS